MVEYSNSESLLRNSLRLTFVVVPIMFLFSFLSLPAGILSVVFIEESLILVYYIISSVAVSLSVVIVFEIFSSDDIPRGTDFIPFFMLINIAVLASSLFMFYLSFYSTSMAFFLVFYFSHLVVYIISMRVSFQ